MTITYLHRPHLPLVYVALISPGGPLVEDESERGYTHFLEHMLYRQNTLGPEAFVWDRLGGQVAFYTYKESFKVQMEFPLDRIHKAFTYMLDCLSHMQFPAMVVEEEREMIRDEVSGQRNRVNFALARAFYQLAFPDSYLTWDVGGTMQSLADVDAARLAAFQQKFLRYFAPQIVVVGAANPLDGLDVPHGDLQPSDIARELRHNPVGDRTGVLIGGQRPFFLAGITTKGYRTAPDHRALAMVNALFQYGRAHRVQREIHYSQGVYYLNLEHRTYRNVGVLFFHGSCSTGVLPAVVEILETFLRDLAANMSEADFEQAKNACLYDLLRAEGEPMLMAVRQTERQLWGAHLPIADSVRDYSYEQFRLGLQALVTSRPFVIEATPRPAVAKGE